MEIYARPAKGNNQIVYWLRSAVAAWLLRAKTESEDDNAPAAIVRSGDHEVVLKRSTSFGRAEREAARFREELARRGAKTSASTTAWIDGCSMRTGSA